MKKLIDHFEHMVIAENSSGFQMMAATAYEDGIKFTIRGDYDGGDFQLDFDTISGLELEHFIEKLHVLGETYENMERQDAK